MRGVEVPQAPREVGEWGGGIPLLTGKRVWGGGCPLPRKFFVFFC